ncbi:MAG: excinuclease ABC subunit UvrC [Terriglobales bacterium]
MDLAQKIRTLPTSPGVYLYKNAEGEVIYVGKAKNLRARVRSYFVEGRAEDAKTGSLLREAVDVEYIVVDNEKEALALENNFIKQRKPRFNILLRDDKTYPYVKLTLGERFPRVYVTRRLRKDGSVYYGPYFPASLAYRIADLIHRHFLIPSCKIDLRRYHPRPCLQFHIGRCLGPCVEGLTTPETYAEAVKDVRLFLEGRQTELTRSLTDRMTAAAGREQYELAAKYRDLISTVELLQQKQRIAAAEGADTDVFGYHYENGMIAVNLFHVRNGRVLDRREFFWEDIPEDALTTSNEYQVISNKRQSSDSDHAPDGLITHYSLLNTFSPGAFFSALLSQLYIGQQYVPAEIFVPVDFDERESLSDLLAEQAGHRVEIRVPRRGEKLALMDLAGNNARASYDQRFRVMKPNARIIAEAVQQALDLPEPPRRIECFDISHIQGAETVASMVVWEDGRMKKSDYRKFIIRTVEGVDDFASMREVVTRRYSRVLGRDSSQQSAVSNQRSAGSTRSAVADQLVDQSRRDDSLVAQDEVLGNGPVELSESRRDGPTPDTPNLTPDTREPKAESRMPSLILIDGGLGQLHAAAEALESLEITAQPLASIAKREEIIYVHGQEDEPIVLDHHNPVLHLIQMIRDEAHRFAVTFHRKRREIRERSSELLDIPGIGDATRRRLLEHFGSARAVSQATEAALTAVVTRPQAEAIISHFRDEARGTRDEARGTRSDGH